MRSVGSVARGVVSAGFVVLTPALAAADDSAKSSHAEPKSPDPVAEAAPARAPVAEIASTGLIVAIRRSAAATPPSRWWLRTDLGPRDASTPMGQMWTASLDDAAGAGGLHLSGVGRGGGGAVGAKREGAILTVGGGAGVDDLDAFDRRGEFSADHVVRAPGPPDRHTPPEVIQRVVRESFGRLDLCYETGLRRRPGLAGRVVVKFVISRSGAVALASDAGSDLGDADVVGCVVRAFDSMTFPESIDSSVTVVYPLVFTPAGAR